MDIKEILTNVVLGQLVPLISKKLNIPEKNVKNVINYAIPLLLGSLAKNAKDPEQAEEISEAISEDHSGNILDTLSSLFSEDTQEDGGKILKHILGENVGKATQTIGEKTDTKSSDVKNILVSVAPLLLNALGNKKQEDDLDTGSFTDLLQETAKESKTKDTKNVLTDLLDQDDDGSVVDDVVGMVGKFLKKK